MKHGPIYFKQSALLGAFFLILEFSGCARFTTSLDSWVPSRTQNGTNSENPSNSGAFSLGPLQNIFITTTTEWKQTSVAPGFGPSEPYTPVANFNGSTYYVWVDSNYRAQVTQVTHGTATTVLLDSTAVDPYTVTPDGHHRFSLGVDKLGYIHVTGDMHHHSKYTDAIEGHSYPKRYQGSNIMYWKSNQPKNVSGGFSFAGNYGSKTTMPGSGWMMGRFFTDNFGELFYSSHVHAYEAPTMRNYGQNALGLYRYNTTTQTWKSIGGIAQTPNDPYLNEVYPVFYWENSGMNGGWFQNYQARFQFDSQNRLHFAVVGNTKPNYAGTDRVLYAVSSDGGQTWNKANGAKISGLPLRGIDGVANLADVVADSGSTAHFLPDVGLAIDRNGRPAVSVPFESKSPVWYVFNGTTWTTQNPLNTAFPLSQTKFAFRHPSGDLFFVAPSPGKIFRMNSFSDTPYGYDFPAEFSGIDESTFRDSGAIYGLSTTNEQVPSSLTQVTFAPGTLPCTWAARDVGDLPRASVGSTGYSGGTFALYEYSHSGIDGDNDSFHFTHLSLTGDGFISARVQFPDFLRIAGIQMRENFGKTSRVAAVFLSNSSLGFAYRSTEGADPSSNRTSVSKQPYFLKLQRSGNVFTAFTSTDGTTWKQVGQTTLALSKTISIGLYSAANHNGYSMQTSLFDQVRTSGTGCTHP